jgi:uncharacterized glyoxalase superfamily protein PhnB
MSLEQIIPVLTYRDIAAAQDFLVKAFGFRAGRIDRDGNGTVVHAEVHHGGGVLWMHRVAPDQGMHAAAKDTESTGLVVHVADVDRHFAHAKAAGATLMSEPRDQPYGQREYGARDPDGHQWWFATPTS